MVLETMLPLARYRAHFDSTRPLRMPEFAGNVWRGALGHALKHSVCVTRQPECPPCPLYRSCLYPYFWETPPHVGAEKMRKYQNAPHPFVLVPQPGAPAQLEFTLIGQANQHLPVFVNALKMAAANPRGIAGNVLALRQLEQLPSADLDHHHWLSILKPGGALTPLPLASALLPAAPAAVNIELLTPMRIKHEGRPVGVAAFTFADLFGSLLRRISMLSYFHSSNPLETDFRGLNAAARLVPINKQLRWVAQHRHSTRQQADVAVDGVVGTIQVAGADLRPYWPFLWIGQWVHAGSAATMGLGRYRLFANAPASLPNADQRPA